MPRILIVGDEAELASELAGILNQTGFDTGTASDPEEAVLKVLDGGWDAVLMDAHMPNSDGADALRIIRRVAPELPVVMFSGQSRNGAGYKCTLLEAFTTLPSPTETISLIATLKQALYYPIAIS